MRGRGGQREKKTIPMQADLILGIIYEISGA
jgi:hypothetical protein